jgi:hypothetical protein
MARMHSPDRPIERSGAPIADADSERATLRPSPGAESAPRLRAPALEEAWRVSAAASRPVGGGDPVAASPHVAGRSTEQPSRPIAAVSQAPSERRTLSAGMGVAAVIVTVVLVGMALLSHGNGP